MTRRVRTSAAPPHIHYGGRGRIRARAGASLPHADGDNRAQHAALQRFMLANDSVTMAVEVPVWLASHDITALDARQGTRPSGRSGAVAGRADYDEIASIAGHSRGSIHSSLKHCLAPHPDMADAAIGKLAKRMEKKGMVV